MICFTLVRGLREEFYRESSSEKWIAMALRRSLEASTVNIEVTMRNARLNHGS